MDSVVRFFHYWRSVIAGFNCSWNNDASEGRNERRDVRIDNRKMDERTNGQKDRGTEVLLARLSNPMAILLLLLLLDLGQI